MKRLLFALLALFVFPSTIFAQSENPYTPPVSGEHIERFHAEITVNTDGTIDVVETIQYDFSTLDRHGIFRTIPFTKRNSDGKRVDLAFENFTITNSQGEEYQFDRSTEDEQIVLKIGDPDKTITGTHTYKISYKVSGALGYFPDHDELYWNVTGNGWEVPIRHATALITLPSEVSLDQISAICFTGTHGATESACEITHDTAVNVLSQRILNPYDGLTTVVGFPKNAVAVLQPEAYVSFWEKPVGQLTIAGIIIGAILWYILLPLWLIFRYFKHGRDPDVGRALTAWYDPPKAGKRDLTPTETGSLIDENVQTRDIFAAIVDLARRGYITIKETEKKKFSLIHTNKPKAKDVLLPFEKTLLDGIFEDGKEVKLKDVKFYKTVQKVEKMVYEGMVTDGFFPTNPKTQRTKYYALGGAGFATFNFILGLVGIVFGRIMPRKTLSGAQAAQVARGMKNFISSQERQLNFQGDKQLLFEKLLPFAVAFGVEKNWAERFKEFDLKNPDWYQGTSTSHFSTALFASSLSNSYNSFSSSATPPSSSSSSGFGGGGFSGGGGGGGGGGSW